VKRSSRQSRTREPPAHSRGSRGGKTPTHIGDGRGRGAPAARIRRWRGCRGARSAGPERSAVGEGGEERGRRQSLPARSFLRRAGALFPGAARAHLWVLAWIGHTDGENKLDN
jgi:hypothetical protein